MMSEWANCGSGTQAARGELEEIATDSRAFGVALNTGVTGTWNYIAGRNIRPGS